MTRFEPARATAAAPLAALPSECDVCIIGSGVGGSAVALSLAASGARICILERGERLVREAQNQDPEAVFVERRYRTRERWLDGAGEPFTPGQYYFVGGHTKFYGTAMFRLRERDFDATDHEDGSSPAWPLRYADLEPHYAHAERLFGVHGRAGDDPTEPPGAANEIITSSIRQRGRKSK